MCTPQSPPPALAQPGLSHTRPCTPDTQSDDGTDAGTNLHVVHELLLAVMARLDDIDEKLECLVEEF